MSTSEQITITRAEERALLFRVVGFVLLLMLLVSAWSSWYANQVTLPRYCDKQEETLQHLEQVLKEPEPAGDNSRIPYIIAAKLIFLVPQQTGENIPDYLERIRLHLRMTCQ